MTEPSTELIKTCAFVKDKTYQRLNTGFEENTGTNGFEALMNLVYAEYVYCNSDSAMVDYLTEKYVLCRDNYIIEEDEHGDREITGYKCICGRPHLHHLNVFEFKRKDFTHIILGSTCVKHLETYTELGDLFPELYANIKLWIKTIEIETKKIGKKPCVSCGEYSIVKKTKYRDEKRNYWCKKCIVQKYVCCVKCKKLREYGWSTYFNQPYFECINCYYNN
tara:strand:+ start:3898 stop:4560 length:663 start_codon:yes stop_codon:yes gene_type:complete